MLTDRSTIYHTALIVFAVMVFMCINVIQFTMLLSCRSKWSTGVCFNVLVNYLLKLTSEIRAIKSSDK